ncbi:MAG: hypothetical protein K2L96_02020 [Muribaculaceae bacterium]|nr:hypothetical protein [Muribaculaceae bacterium]
MKKIALILCALALSCSAFAQQPAKGYRGFADWSNSFAAYKWAGDESKTALWFTGIFTSHGYQFTPNLFLGGGVGFEASTKMGLWTVPVFAHLRTDQQWGDFTPFGDLRIGYNVADGGGLYLCPSIGYRFYAGGAFAMNISLGMTLRGSKRELYEVGHVDDNLDTPTVAVRHTDGHKLKAMFNFRIGMDF